MTAKTRKIMMYTGAVVTTISLLVVTAAGLSLMSLYDISWQEAVIFWLNAPLLSGVLSAAIAIAICLLALPVLGCVWLINELTRSNNHMAVTHESVAHGYIPYRENSLSVGPLKPSGCVFNSVEE